MIAKIFTDTLMIFLITYALIDILYRFLNFLNRIGFETEKSNKKVLFLCNSDDEIEKITRFCAQETKDNAIIVLKKETHETFVIINRLKCEFPYIKFITLSDEVISQIFPDAS